MRVGLMFDCDASGSSVCSSTTEEISTLLAAQGHEVALIGTAGDLVDKLAAGGRFDLVFTGLSTTSQCAKSGYSESVVPNLLSLYGIAFTGCSAPTIELCRQLNVMKSLLRDRGVPTTDYWLVETLGDISRIDATYPVIVTSVHGGHSDESLTVADAQELSKACCQLMSQWNSPVIVQPCLSGQIVDVGVLGGGATAKVLMPKDLDATVAKHVERTTLAAWRIVRGWDSGCIRLQCDSDGIPHVVSIDPAPNLNSNERFMQLASQAGLSMSDVVMRIAQAASQRLGLDSHGPSLRTHLNRASSKAEGAAEPSVSGQHKQSFKP